MFSAKHSFFAERKECKLKKADTLPKIGGCLSTCENGVFLFFLFSFCWFFGGFVCFFIFGLLLEKTPSKGYPSCNFRGLSSSVPPKALSLKSFSSSYSVFPCFPFVFPFENIPYFLCFVHQPLLGKHYILCFFCLFVFLFLFPLSVFASFFETSVPNVPFFKPNLLSFLGNFCCFCFGVHVSCFCFLMFAGFVYGVIFFVTFCVCFISCFVFRL